MPQVTFVDAIDIVRGAPDSVKDGQRKRARLDVHADLSGTEKGCRDRVKKSDFGRFFCFFICKCQKFFVSLHSKIKNFQQTT